MAVIPARDLELEILTKIDSIRKIMAEVKFSKRAVVQDIFIDLLEDLLGLVRSTFLSEIEVPRTSGFEDEEAQVTLISLRYMAFIRKLNDKLLPFVETREPISISSETQFVLRNLIKKFPEQPSYALALVRTWEYNYTVHAYKNLYQTLVRSFRLRATDNKEYPNWFIFLKHPNIEATNILLNCLFSHEIAHFKDYLNGYSDHLIKQIKVDESEFQRHLKLLLKEKIPIDTKGRDTMQLTLGDFIGATIKQDFYEKVNSVMHNWLKEIIADLLALRTFGPAFIYSLIQSSTLLQLIGEYSDTHPASSWRISYCLSELKYIKFLEKQKNEGIEKYLKDWENYLNNTHREPNQPVYSVSYVSLKNSFNKILEKIRDISRLFTFDVEKYNDEVEIIKRECFLKSIAPIAKWNGTHHQSFNNIYTLNAVWEIFLTNISRFYKNFDIETIDDKIKANEVLHNLTLKAIESSDILRIWQDTM